MTRRWLAGAALIGLMACAAFGLGTARGQDHARENLRGHHQSVGRDPAASPRETPRGTDAPSPLIYPPQQIALRMNHALPAHRELRCVRCHRGAGVSERARDSLLPREESCQPCHEADLDRVAPSEARCGTCHIGFGERDEIEVPATVIPTARLRFSHRTHVNRGTRCLECHRGVGDAEQADRGHLPTMRQCFECHGPPGFAAESSAPSTCETCHLTRPDGLLRTRFPEGEMNPPSWLFDMRHDHEWLVRHRWVAADQGQMCAQCHQESDCVDCHDGRVRLQRLHPGDYLTTHVAEARRDQPRCASCHQVTRFCGECHARLGLSPISAPEVRLAVRYHPPAALWTRGPVQHGIEARRAMNTCASCHSENDCVQCHGASGVGAGVSPHPLGFEANCGRALALNDRACRTCHGDVEALRRVCR